MAAPPRRHWFSLAPIPDDSPVISTRRAYIEALGVYVLFFGPSIVAAAGSLANFNEPNPEGWWITGPNGFEEIVTAALAVVVTLLLAERRGRKPRDLGLVLARPKGGPGTRQAIRMAAWAALAFFVGSVVTSALATGNFPFGHVSVANTVLDLTAAGNAGIVEELVVVGFLVTTLEQARRPRWEIFTVAMLCRAGYHIYYGPGVFGIFIWAAVFLWLFWRFRSIVPMMIAHICWDTIVFLIQVSDAFDAVLLLGILALEITAAIMWLVDRSEQQSAVPPWQGGPWPGSPWAGGWQGAPPGYWRPPGGYPPGPQPAPGPYGQPAPQPAPGPYGQPAPGPYGVPPAPQPAPSPAPGWGPPAGSGDQPA